MTTSQTHYSGADVSVVVVNWNSGEHLKRCVESLAKQTVKPAQVFVVDNASVDKSLAQADLSNICLIRLSENTGFAKANNAAIAQSQTAWIATLNPDACAKPDWIENLVASANEFGARTMFACRQLSAADETILDGTGDVYHVSGLAWRRDYERKTADETLEQPLFSPCAAAAMYPAEAVKEAGGFDEDYFCYFEDVDLAFRLRHQGISCRYLDKAVVSHVGYASSAKDSPLTMYYGHRNLVWTFVKNMPAKLFWKHLLQHFALNVLTVVYYGFKGRAGSMLKAKAHALMGLSGALKKRKRIMQTSRLDVPGLESSIQITLFPRRNRRSG